MKGRREAAPGPVGRNYKSREAAPPARRLRGYLRGKWPDHCSRSIPGRAGASLGPLPILPAATCEPRTAGAASCTGSPGDIRGGSRFPRWRGLLWRNVGLWSGAVPRPPERDVGVEEKDDDGDEEEEDAEGRAAPGVFPRWQRGGSGSEAAAARPARGRCWAWAGGEGVRGCERPLPQPSRGTCVATHLLPPRPFPVPLLGAAPGGGIGVGWMHPGARGPPGAGTSRRPPCRVPSPSHPSLCPTGSWLLPSAPGARGSVPGMLLVGGC